MQIEESRSLASSELRTPSPESPLLLLTQASGPDRDSVFAADPRPLLLPGLGPSLSSGPPILGPARTKKVSLFPKRGRRKGAGGASQPPLGFLYCLIFVLPLFLPPAPNSLRSGMARRRGKRPDLAVSCQLKQSVDRGEASSMEPGLEA